MDLVEKAAQRLAQLQKAGIDAPVPAAAQAPPASPGADAIPTPERFAQALEQAQAAGSRVATPTPAPTAAPAMPVNRQPSPAEGRPRSKEVHIDLEALAAAGFVTPQAQRSQIADEFRVMKRPIIRNAREHTGPRAERSKALPWKSTARCFWSTRTWPIHAL